MPLIRIVLTSRKRDIEKRKETQQFSDIRDDLKAAIKQGSEHFDATMTRSDTIMAGILAGSYENTNRRRQLWIHNLHARASERWLNQFPTTSGPCFLVSITSHGRYPLRGLHVWMMDPERQLQAMQHPETDAVQSAHAGDTYYEVPYLRPQSPEALYGRRTNTRNLSIWNEGVPMTSRLRFLAPTASGTNAFICAESTALGCKP